MTHPLAPVFAQYPLAVDSAHGVWLHTADGRRVLDLYRGHAMAALGYGHTRWTQAVRRQAQSLNFQSNTVRLEVRTRAAARPLKFAAGAITWQAEHKWYGFPRAPFEVQVIPRRDSQALSAITERTAAVIVEPVQGGGAFDLGPEYLAALRKHCDAVGAILIFDEVQCDMGRVGAPFAANLYGVAPDMITTAKALGNGFPCAALLMNPRVAAAVKLDALGTTFGGGPMACAAVEAVIEAIESERLLENVRRIGALIRERCLVGPVRGYQGAGLLAGLICGRPAKQVHQALLERDILAGTSSDPQVLRLLPSFILQPEHVEQLRSALQELGT